MMKLNLIRAVIAGSFFLPSCSVARNEDAKPNIIFILADDLGYGDVHFLNRERGLIPTPNLDGLALQGMTFTDAHSSSAVCTPTRYSILTGRYNWRSSLQKGVLGVYAKPLISEERLTVADLLKQKGYTTACIGKWHLGWEWPKKGDEIDFTQAIKGGPLAAGFEYYFGTDVPNYPPYCFIENDHTVGIPSVPLPDSLLGNNLASKPGPGLPGWRLEAILPGLTDKACGYISTQAKKEKPFFLYFALTTPHTPLAPSKEWQGKSGLGTYADLVMETDWAIGEVLSALDKAGVANNTLVLVASDNGVAPYVGIDSKQLKQLEEKGFSMKEAEHKGMQRYKELEAMGHYSSNIFRGHKSDIWDGGHRIPLLVRWPGKVVAGSSSNELVSLVDFMATCADITGAKIPDNAGEDCVSLLPILLGKSTKPVHEAVVFHSINGSFAIQQGQWKLILCPDSGGWGDPTPESKEAENLPGVQLYDMNHDEGEQFNLYATHPEIVEQLTKLLEKYVADGRTTSGAKQSNDVSVDIFKKK